MGPWQAQLGPWQAQGQAECAAPATGDGNTKGPQSPSSTSAPGGRGWGTLLMKLCCELALMSRAGLHGHWPWQHSLYSFLDTGNAQQSTRRIFEIKAFKNQGPVANSISDSAKP
ncbi:unnamed protein product [Eretmochelys imbricata]